MLAFATVAHAGVTVAALSAFTPEAFAGAALYFGGYAFAVAGLFMAVAVVRSISGREIDILLSIGSGRGLVLTGSIFALGTLEVACVWPSTRAIVVETMGWHAILVLALFTIVAGATGGACLRAFRAIFFAGDATRDPKLRVKWFMIAPAAFFVSVPPLTIVPAVSAFVSRAAEQFLDADRYRSLSLGGYVAIEPGFAALPHHAVAWLAACSAVVVAFLVLSKQRIFRVVRVALGRSGVVRFLVGTHDGDVGAYVAWIVGAVAVVTGFVSNNR
jgi:formate hydrogenlyase subunit 3/multisubunit Na+/H+ antiporter MnhD subunit